MFKTFGKSFTLQKPMRPPQGFEMEPYSGNTPRTTIVSRLYLGSTLYLLEEYESGIVSYALESEGHAEGFSLGGLISNMNAYALQNGMTDCYLPLSAAILILSASDISRGFPSRARLACYASCALAVPVPISEPWPAISDPP
jgi:hypothetical protein